MMSCERCDDPARVSGLCFAHLYEVRRAERAVAYAALAVCSVPGCARPHQARGLCNAHYARARRDVPLTPPAPTPVPVVELHAEGWGRLDATSPKRRPFEVLLEELAVRRGVPCWPVEWVTNSASGRKASQARWDRPGGEAA